MGQTKKSQMFTGLCKTQQNIKQMNGSVLFMELSDPQTKATKGSEALTGIGERFEFPGKEMCTHPSSTPCSFIYCLATA
jgi:hypothetical protein